MPNQNLTRSPDTSARFLGNFENNSPEWHALRKTGIGGSDVGTITNCNPWQSPFSLWARKTGRISDDFTSSEAAEWGTRLESVVLDKFEEMHPELNVLRDLGTWCHPLREWMLANPDGIGVDVVTGEHYIIEIKTARFMDDWANGVPAYYRTQVQWYLHVFGYKKAIVAALFSGSTYREFEVEADVFEQETNLAEVRKFLTYVQTDEQPDYDGSLATYETVRELNPNIDPDEHVELGDLGKYAVLALHEAAEAERKSLELKSRVLDAMGNAKRGLIDGDWVFTRQARTGGKPYLIQKKS